jgi:hypothetical protein
MTRLVAMGAIIGFALTVLAISVWPKKAAAPAPTKELRAAPMPKTVIESAVPVAPARR